MMRPSRCGWRSRWRPGGETQAPAHLAVAVFRAGDLDSAVQLAGQAEQNRADIPGRIARWCSNFLTLVLTEAGELAAADRVCAAGWPDSGRRVTRGTRPDC